MKEIYIKIKKEKIMKLRWKIKEENKIFKTKKKKSIKSEAIIK